MMAEPDGDPVPEQVPDADVELAEWAAELADRLQAGERVDLEALANQHPEHAERMRRLIPTIKMMAGMGSGHPPLVPLTEKNEILPDPRGHVLGDFRLIREIGRGGMGIVYEAHEIWLDRRVALKILPSTAALDPRRLLRFQVEARAAAGLHHTHIVPIFRVGSDRGVQYYAMQLVEGKNLAEIIGEMRRQEGRDLLDETERGVSPPRTLTDSFGELEPGENHTLDVVLGLVRPPISSDSSSSFRTEKYFRLVATLGMQAAEALEHAHEREVLHRDIKPSNLLVDRQGKLWITDFGLARIRAESDLTLTGDVLGTIRYMSPEQALGKRVPIDARTDVYSLGITLYELLTLEPAFAGRDRQELLRKIAWEEPCRPRRLNRSVPRDLETVVLKAMAKDPNDRYATAQALADDLRRYLENRSIQARRPALVDRTSKWMRRHRAWVGAGVVVASTFAMVALVGLWRYNAERAQYNKNLADAVRKADQNAREANLQRERADWHNQRDRLLLAREAILAGDYLRAREDLEAMKPASGVDGTNAFVWQRLWRAIRRLSPVSEEEYWGGRYLDISLDGKSLAYLGKDGRIKVWDLVSGKPRSIIHPPGRVSAAALWEQSLSPDGLLLACLGVGDLPRRVWHRIWIWDTAAGRLRVEQKSPSNECLIAVLMATDQRYVTASVPLSNPDDIWRVRLWEPGPTPEQPHLVSLLSEQCTGAMGFWSSRFLWSTGARIIEVGEKDRHNFFDSRTGGVIRSVAGKDPPIVVVGDRQTYFDFDYREMHANFYGYRGDKLFETDDLLHPNEIRFGVGGRTVALSNQRLGTITLFDREKRSSHTIRATGFDVLQALAVQFSPDGELVAVASQPARETSRTLTLWEVSTGKKIATCPEQIENFQRWWFTSNNQAVFISTSDRRSWIWRIDPPPDPETLAGHTDEAWAVAFAPDGKTLATGSDDTHEPQTIKIWDAGSGRLLRGWNGKEGTVVSLAFHPGGQWLATAHLVDQGQIRLWDVRTGNLIGEFAGPPGQVRAIAFSPDGKALASGGDDGIVRLWDVATHRIKELRGHVEKVHSVAFSPDGQRLATAGKDRTVLLWDVATQKLLHRDTNPDGFKAVAFSPDGTRLATVDTSGRLAIRDALNLAILHTISGDGKELRCLAFTPDSHAVAAAGVSATIYVWDVATGQELVTLPGHKEQINGLAFAPNRTTLASCSHDGSVYLWRSYSTEGSPSAAPSRASVVSHSR